MKKLIISIEKEQIEQKRFDLISRSLTLGLIELGYPNISIVQLQDKDDRIQFRIEDNS